MNIFDDYGPNGPPAKQIKDANQQQIDRSKLNNDPFQGVPFQSEDRVGSNKSGSASFSRASVGGPPPAPPTSGNPAAKASTEVAVATSQAAVTTPRGEILGGFKITLTSAGGTNNPAGGFFCNALRIEEGAARFSNGKTMTFGDDTSKQSLGALVNPYYPKNTWHPFGPIVQNTTILPGDPSRLIGDVDSTGAHTGTYSRDTILNIYITPTGLLVNDNSVTGQSIENVQIIANAETDILWVGSVIVPANRPMDSSMAYDRRDIPATLDDIYQHDRLGSERFEMGGALSYSDFNSGQYAHRGLFELKEHFFYNAWWARTSISGANAAGLFSSYYGGAIALDSQNRLTVSGATVPTFLPNGKSGIVPKPGFMPGNGIQLRMIQGKHTDGTVDPLDWPTIVVDLDVTHAFNEGTAQPRTGTINYAFTTSGVLSATAQLPSHCQGKIVMWTCEGNTTGMPWSVERDGQNLGTTVRLAPQYTVNTSTLNLDHTHTFNYTVSGAAQTGTTNDALNQAITYSSVNPVAVVANSNVTLRWVLMN